MSNVFNSFQEKIVQVATLIMTSILENANILPFPVESIATIAGAIDSKYRVLTFNLLVHSHIDIVIQSHCFFFQKKYHSKHLFLLKHKQVLSYSRVIFLYHTYHRCI